MMVKTSSATKIAVTAATGAMAMKMLAQLKCSSSQPPTIGPVAMATPAIAPHKPMARARSLRSVKTLEISERRERARAIGLWGAIAGVAIATGPIVGGWLLEHFSWASIFIAMAPVAAVTR